MRYSRKTWLRKLRQTIAKHAGIAAPPWRARSRLTALSEAPRYLCSLRHAIMASVAGRRRAEGDAVPTLERRTWGRLRGQLRRAARGDAHWRPAASPHLLPRPGTRHRAGARFVPLPWADGDYAVAGSTRSRAFRASFPCRASNVTKSRTPRTTAPATWRISRLRHPVLAACLPDRSSAFRYTSLTSRRLAALPRSRRRSAGDSPRAAREQLGARRSAGGRYPPGSQAHHASIADTEARHRSAQGVSRSTRRAIPCGVQAVAMRSDASFAILMFPGGRVEMVDQGRRREAEFVCCRSWWRAPRR